ncbi:MAG: HAD family hydrolase [Puniceicoccales bacterium]|jgi:phosphoglycolate phosphatase|nr:HAD family hydrolase [Puniceicoccales bacterium]
MSPTETQLPCRIQTVLFDLDGTLVDNFTAIHRAYSDVVRTLGLPPMTQQEVMDAVGGSITVTMRRLIGEAQADEAVRLYLQHFPTVMFEGLRVYDGVVALLSVLKRRGLRLAVYTNKTASTARCILEHLDMACLFDGIFGTKEVPWCKPDPQFTRFVLGKLDADAATTIMIGDSPFDIATARNGKLAAVYCVTTGSHSAGKLAEHLPDGIFPGFAELGRAVFPNAPGVDCSA